jgi:elongation factor Ts
MKISAVEVKALRDKTGAGFMECKAALTEAQGDLEQATTILRTRGQASAAKRVGRTTSEGFIGSYIHMGRVGVIVELNCESDFVARTDDFQGLARELAMHIAAANPQFVRREDVPVDVLEREKDIFRGQMADSGKPPAVIDKIVDGKLRSFFEQHVLLDQPSIRDPKTTIGELVTAAIAKLGENITVSRFARLKVGESV